MKSVLRSTGAELSSKIIILGDPRVGKTTFLKRVTGTPETQVCMDIVHKLMEVDSKTIRLELWDEVSRKSNLKNISKLYYNKAEAVILVYSVSDRNSFNNILAWMDAAKSHVQEAQIKFWLVANKSDMKPSDRLVTFDEGQTLASTLKIQNFWEVSALTGEGIQLILLKIAEELIHVAPPILDQTTSSKLIPYVQSSRPNSCNC